MATKDLYKNDLIRRYASHTFEETTTGSLINVKFKNASSVVIEEATKLVLIDAYRAIRGNLLIGETPAFLSTTTERDALTNVDAGTLIDNITSGHIERYNGVAWKSATEESNTIGVTASTTQTQAGGTSLTSSMNFVETVANENDAVKLFSAANGEQISIINEGANILQIFPSAGDDLGNGVNASTTLELHEEITFWGKDATTWHIRYTTEIFHAEIHDEDNTTAFTINAQNDHHAYHSAGVTFGDLAGWTFNEGSNGTSFAIVGISNGSGGSIDVEVDAAHGLAIGDIICQTGLSDSNYVGFFKVLTISSSVSYTITATWGATGTGFMNEPSYIQVQDIAIGTYMITWTSSLSVVGTTITLDFFLHDGISTIVGSKGRHRIASSSAFKSVGGQAIRKVVSGDRIFFALSNTTNASNVIIRNFSLIAIKL